MGHDQDLVEYELFFSKTKTKTKQNKTKNKKKQKKKRNLRNPRTSHRRDRFSI